MRGKTAFDVHVLGLERGASMRPPQNAGENRDYNGGGAISVALQ